MEKVVLVAVLACDYGKTDEGQHDGQTLGERSIARLEKALEFVKAQALPVQFVFSAGTLDEADARLCNLQMRYVEARGFKSHVPPRRMHIWGSDQELQFLANTALDVPGAKVVIVSEDYHLWRLGKIAKSLGLKSAKVLGASSLQSPPSFGNLVHEVLGIGVLYLPTWLVQRLKQVRQRRLRRNLKA